MKLHLLAWLKQEEGETMATFGRVRLVKKLTGKIELLGGSPAAHEWCSLFLHEAVVACLPPTPAKRACSVIHFWPDTAGTVQTIYGN